MSNFQSAYDKFCTVISDKKIGITLPSDVADDTFRALILRNALLIKEGIDVKNAANLDFKALIAKQDQDSSTNINKVLDSNYNLLSLDNDILAELFNAVADFTLDSEENIFQFISYRKRTFSYQFAKLITSLIDKDANVLVINSWSYIFLHLLNSNKEHCLSTLRREDSSLNLLHYLNNNVAINEVDYLDDIVVEDDKYNTALVSFSLEPMNHLRRFIRDQDKFTDLHFGGFDDELYLNLLLNSKIDKIYALCSVSMLFSEKAKNLRKKLIENKYLKAIVFMPSGVLQDSSLLTALLVVDKSSANDKVRFIDLEGSGHTSAVGRIRNITINDFDSLVAKIKDENTNYEGIVNIDVDDIVQKNYILNKQRYALESKDQKMEAFLQTRETIALGKIVNIERGFPFRAENGNTKVFEVNANDLQDGFLNKPTKEIFVSENIVDNFSQSFLKEGDIVILVKGSVGKIAYISSDIPEIGEGGFVIGQTGLILRMKSNAKIDSKTLFIFLRSKLGQKLLASYVTGNVIQSISVKDLKQFEILIPTDEEVQKAHAILDADLKTKEAIAKLKDEQDLRYSSLWSLEL